VQAQAPWRAGLRADVLAALDQPTLGNVIDGVSALAWRGAALLAIPMLAVLSFLAIEMWLVGRPAPWRALRFALAVQMGLIVFYHAIGAIPFLSGKWPEGWAPQPLILLQQADMPLVLTGIAQFVLVMLSLLAASFAGYWTHRARHRTGFLWRFHKVHHSLDRLSAVQNFSHPIDGFGDRLGAMALGLLLGFNLETLILLAAFKTIYDSLIHSPAPINVGPLNGWLVDNRVHFLHHSRDPADYDCNFGSWFTIWDRLFGTWKAPPDGPLMPTGVTGVLPPESFREFALADLRKGPV
jgi:sterol desaturase/sphingolipid hydroxylase (fatty acid hydroxylase superfamily)